MRISNYFEAIKNSAVAVVSEFRKAYEQGIIDKYNKITAKKTKKIVKKAE